MKKLFIILAIFTTFAAIAQSVAINTNGSAANASAILDVSSTTKGFLLPRVTTPQRNAINSPANGLTVFNTTTNSLNVFFLGQWNQINTSLPQGSIVSLNASSPTNNGSLVNGFVANSVSSVVSYTGGNGEIQSGQTVASTGVTGLTATLTSANLEVGNGTLTYTITGTPTSVGTANFALNIGGQTATLSRTVVQGSITSLSTSSPTNIGSLNIGVAANGASSVVSYTGGNGGTHSGQTVTSTGVTGLTATLISANFAVGNGTLTYTITGTPTSDGTASFALNIGGQAATLTRSVAGLQIGSAYQGGIIFYVDASGLHGKIASTTNQSTGTNWANAITICNNLVVSGYSGWYLPSISELQLMRSNIGQGASGPNYNIGNLEINFYYWSSTEWTGDVTQALLFAFFDNSQARSTKTSPSSYYVRAIRSF